MADRSDGALRARRDILAARINEKLAAKGMGVRKLAEKVQAVAGPKARGSSYAGIRQLVEAKVLRPRREIVEAIAAVLGVRADWLLGEGEETESLQGSATAAHTEPDDSVSRIRKAITAAFPEYDRLPFYLQSPVHMLALRLADDLALLESDHLDDWPAALNRALASAGNVVGLAMQGPRSIFGKRITDQALQVYAMAMVQALQIIIPDLRSPGFHVFSEAPDGKD